MLFGYTIDTTNSLAFSMSILPVLLRGMVVTLQATAVGFIIALVLGLVWAILKGARSRLISWPAAFITEFLRDTPLLIQLFYLYYVLPEFGVTLPAFMTGALALGLQYSAYLSEVYRGGIEAIAKGQYEAAKALNLTKSRTFTHIVLPQAIPRIVPAMGNYLISMTKDVPILSVVTVLEMLNLARAIGDRTYNYLVPLSLVGGLYLIMTLLASAAVRLLDRNLPKTGIALK